MASRIQWKDTDRTPLRAALALALAAMLLSSCSQRIGWGVVLWPPEGSALTAGELVPVRFKSNISKTYAVDVPGSKAKEELELWRLSFHTKKGAAKDMAASYAELAPVFGIATRDGLLMREEADNKADQVYRLRVDQEVKLLAKVEGASVETGGEELEGDWYRALADDGTTGYVFSNQLTLWDSASAERPDLSPDQAGGDPALSPLFETVWRPDYFDAMVDSGLIDFGTYSPKLGVFVDPVHKQIRVERSNFSKAYTYERIAKRDDGGYDLEPTGASFRFNKDGGLVFTPPAADTPNDNATQALVEAGTPFAMTFVRQRDDPKDVIAAEERRRLSALSEFVAKGERFESDDSGVLIVTRSARVTWASYDALTPQPIPAGSGETGSISMDLYLAPELASRWDGAFTIRFDQGDKPAVSFAYHLTNTGMDLAWIRPEWITRAVVSGSAELQRAASFTRYR